jgi:NAD+ synthase
VDISLLGGLYKSEIYEIARILEIPECVIKRRPINSTWANDKVGTYFGEIPEGLTPEEAYQVLDAVLYGLYDLRYTPSRVAIDLGHNLDFVRRVYERIKSQDHRRKIPCFAPVTFQTRYPSNLPGDFGRYEMEMMYEAAKVQNFKTND